MSAKHRILQTALTMGQSTVKDIAASLSMSDVTVRSALTGYKHFFVVTKTDKGVRGGQEQLWEIRPESVDDINEEILQGESQSRPGPKVRNPSSTPELVTAEDLVHYDPLPGSTVILSLIRKILTGMGVTHLELPGGEGIRLPGYDGRVSSIAPAFNVPLGESVWEFGVGKNPRDKANKDFRKRTGFPGDIDPATTTFVIVVSGRINNKHGWENDRKAESAWKDVQVRDADDIATWFEAFPSIHVWLSEEMGLRPTDVITLDAWYDTWLRQTDPALPETLLLAGRESEVKALCDDVKKPGGLVAVYGRSQEEALSFAAAALRQVRNDLPPGPYLPLLVKTEEEWARLTRSMSSGILVSNFLSADVSTAMDQGLTVVVPLGPGDDKSKATVELGSINRFDAASLLEKTELSSRPDDPKLTRAEIDTIVESVDRSIAAFRRSRSINPQRAMPSWASTDSELFSALVLVGAWEVSSPSDRAFVERVTGQTHDEVVAKLKVVSLTDDPPFIATAGGWTLTSPKDAALLLLPRLAANALARWESEAAALLNPLSPQEIGTFGYSSSLRGGVSRSAILLGESDDANHRAAASKLVRELLSSTDIDVWLAYSRLLPNLAEAAPDDFMDALEVFVQGASIELTAKITNSTATIYGGPWTPFVGLVWSLELLCQSPDHCAQAFYRLAQLANLDPDWKNGNHPFDSLRRALVPWFPQIALNRQDRKTLLEGLVVRYPDVAWRLLVSLLPGMHDSTNPLYAPTLRNWHTKGDVTVHESYEGWRDVASVATTMAIGEPERLIKLIESTRFMDSETRSRIFDAVTALQPSEFAESQTRVWDMLRELTTRHRQFPDAQWSLEEADLSRLETIVESWSPVDVVEKNAFLFSGHPQLPSPRVGTENYDELVSTRRNAAFCEIMAADPSDRLVQLIERAPDAYTVGIAIADNPSFVDQSSLLPWFELGKAQAAVARAWLIRSFDLRDAAWQRTILADLASLSTKAQTDVFMSLAHRENIFELLVNASEEVRNGFWAGVTAFQLSRSADVEVVVEAFLDKNRSTEAIHFLSSRRNVSVTPEMILRVLTAFENAGEITDMLSTMLSFEVGNLLDLLVQEDADEAKIAHFEFVFAPLLQYERPPAALFRQLAANPSHFVELVSNAYNDDRTTPENRVEQAPEEMALARLSYDALREWRTLPGARSDGTIDGSALSTWVKEAREGLDKLERTRGGDHCIGQLLSGSPVGSDAVWPAEEVRDILESIESKPLRDGFEGGKLNARGVTTRGMFDGGLQEAALAQRFEEDARQVTIKWPAVARILRNLAAHYHESVRREDLVMQRMRDMRA
jgi:hypothetical protein